MEKGNRAMKNVRGRKKAGVAAAKLNKGRSSPVGDAGRKVLS